MLVRFVKYENSYLEISNSYSNVVPERGAPNIKIGGCDLCKELLFSNKRSNGDNKQYTPLLIMDFSTAFITVSSFHDQLEIEINKYNESTIPLKKLIFPLALARIA